MKAPRYRLAQVRLLVEPLMYVDTNAVRALVRQLLGRQPARKLFEV